MVSFNFFKLAAVAALSVSSAAAPLQSPSTCGWLGCTVEQSQKPLGGQSSHDVDSSALSPAQIVDHIKQLTSKVHHLGAPANSITAINGPLLIIGQGPFPSIIAGFSDIITTGTAVLSQISGTKPLKAGDDADSIADAWKEFSRVSGFVLRTMQSKASLFSTVPFIGQPNAAVLRQYETIVDTLAFSIIDLVESRASDISSVSQEHSKALDTTISAFDGLSTM